VSRTVVLDASALMTYFEKSSGAPKVAELIRQARNNRVIILMSAVNWGEVYYSTLKEGGRQEAESMKGIVASLPMEVVHADARQAELAGDIKVAYGVPYADCFAAALARSEGASLMTMDRDFKTLEDQIKIIWV